MNNIIRKELRIIVEKLGQLEKACSFQAEKDEIEYARVHVNPKKKYVEPKSSFKYVEL